MKEWVALGALVALAGCAESHTTCAGDRLPEGDFVLRLEAAEELLDDCPVGLAGNTRPGSLVPTWCEPVEERADACGASVRFRCAVDDARDIIAESIVEMDVAWAADGAEGGATVTSRGPDGEVVCVGEYDARVYPEP